VAVVMLDTPFTGLFEFKLAMRAFGQTVIGAL
jgi:hypothetical protein